MASPNAATPAPAVAGNGRRADLAGERIGKRNTKKSPFRHAENLPSRAQLARRFPGLRLNRYTGAWRDDATGKRGDDAETLWAFLREGGR